MQQEIIQANNVNAWKIFPFYDVVVMILRYYISSTGSNGTIHKFIVIRIYLY